MTDFAQFRLLFIMVAGWISREQASAIAYLIEENRVLKEQLEANEKRLVLTDDPRRRLAAKGKPLGRKVLATIATIVTADTILRWHRELIAAEVPAPRPAETPWGGKTTGDSWDSELSFPPDLRVAPFRPWSRLRSRDTSNRKV